MKIQDEGWEVLISPGNDKLGKVPNFSITAIDTCPGRTAVCSEFCYAHRDEKLHDNTVGGPRRFNLKMTELPTFASNITDSLKIFHAENQGLQVLRVHEGGDFYSAEYVRKWVRIAEWNRDWKFFAYTRSWRIPEIREELVKLKRLINFKLLASTDLQTGAAPAGWREAGINFSYSGRAERCPEEETQEFIEGYREELGLPPFEGERKRLQSVRFTHKLIARGEIPKMITQCGNCTRCWRSTRDIIFKGRGIKHGSKVVEFPTSPRDVL